jgi:hypothetical protein
MKRKQKLLTFEAQIVLFSFPACYKKIISMFKSSIDAHYIANRPNNFLLVVRLAVVVTVVVVVVAVVVAANAKENLTRS